MNLKDDDPVRMYMREMGTVDLLTREGEIKIAKRIEDGLKQVQRQQTFSSCKTLIQRNMIALEQEDSTFGLLMSLIYQGVEQKWSYMTPLIMMKMRSILKPIRRNRERFNNHKNRQQN